MTSEIVRGLNGNPATLADVAKHANVSLKTVSRVLNKSPNVKQATRDHVEKAMRELSYRPNTPARMLASNKTFLIGLIYNSSSSYIANIQNGALKACKPEHYDLLIHPIAYDDPSLLDNLREFIASKRVDGLMLLPPLADVKGVQELLDEHKVTNIAISRRSGGKQYASVSTNDREICHSMVRHLVDLGHKRIAYVRAHPDHKAMTDRFNGYLDGMAEAKLKIDDSLCAQGDNSFESGVTCGRDLLALNPRPTAIFCANDHMATGVMKAAHELGIAIPNDLSIAGFDDVPLASRVWPELTTIKQPIEEMAMRATEDLIKMIRDQACPHSEVVFEAQIVERYSTGPVPAET